MIGMVYKDFLVLRKQISYYLIFLVIYAVLAIAGVFGPAILPAIVVVIGMMLPMSSISYDDMARWDKYAASTPAGRQGMVMAKYLFSLLSLLVIALLVLVLTTVLSLLNIMTVNPLEMLFTTLACIGVAMLLEAVIIPLLLKFGAEKSRTISMIIFVAVFGGVFLISSVLEKGGSLPMPPAWLVSALPVVLALVSVGAFVVSYFISLGIMAKKEL